MIRVGLKVKTAAATAAVSTADAKLHLRVTNTEDNTYIDNLVLAATQKVEAFTNRNIIRATFNLYLTGFPKNGIVLPLSPVSSITSIKYYDSDNSLQTYSSASWFYSIYEEPVKVDYIDTPAEAYQYRYDAVDVEFVCGYATAADVPESLISAILLLVGDMYENRVDYPRERFTAWQSLAYPYRVWHSTTENV